MQETLVQSLGWEDSLEEGMATHSTFLPVEFHDRGVWQATVHGTGKNQTRLSNSHTHTYCLFSLYFIYFLSDLCYFLPSTNFGIIFVFTFLVYSSQMFFPNKFLAHLILSSQKIKTNTEGKE